MNKNSGFTLLELLVVIAIVIVLAALVLTGLRASNESAKRLKALNQIRQLGLAVTQYAADNNGEFPGVAHKGSVTWSYSLRSYLGLDENASDKELRRVLCSPGETVASRWYSYAVNDYIGSGEYGFHRLNQIPAPSQTMLFAERSSSYNQDHFHFAEGLTEESFRNQVAVDRYKQGGVYLFTDGHAEYLPWETARERVTSTPFVNPGE